MSSDGMFCFLKMGGSLLSPSQGQGLLDLGSLESFIRDSCGYSN